MKQGDPLSPFIFNAVMDEFLTEVDHKRGINVNGTDIEATASAALWLLWPEVNHKNKETDGKSTK